MVDKHALLHGLVPGICVSGSGGWRASVALGTVLLIARPSHAQVLEPTLLTYRAPETCPEVAEFQRSVQRRSARVRFVDEGSHERELAIALSKEGDSTIGELRLIERDGSLRQRSVRFSSCAEAVEGLALITVVSLDPQALLQTPPTPEPVAKEPTLPPAPPKRASKPLVPSKPQLAPPPPPFEPRSSQLEIAVGGEFLTGLHQFPQTAFGGALFVDAASASPDWFAPLVRFAIGHSERRYISTGDGDANFALTQATLTACPVRIGQRAISVRPCAFTSAGVLRAWTTASLDPQTSNRPSWSWGGSVLVSIKVSQITDIIADIALGSPLIRDRFEAGPPWAWTTPPLYLSSGAGLRFVFR
ncbi:MAG: hypothetical protein ABIQ16_25210 [Polyangiaceae bacterium]